jgi:hypothetical protein
VTCKRQPRHARAACASRCASLPLHGQCLCPRTLTVSADAFIVIHMYRGGQPVCVLGSLCLCASASARVCVRGALYHDHPIVGLGVIEDHAPLDCVHYVARPVRRKRPACNKASASPTKRYAFPHTKLYGHKILPMHARMLVSAYLCWRRTVRRIPFCVCVCMYVCVCV